MTEAIRPKVGAAMRLERLRELQHWYMPDHRDLEIQDSANPALLDGDWESTAREVTRVLDGYQGRLGVHGPFIDLTIGANDSLIRQAVIKRLLTGLEFAAIVGASHMVIHSPVRFLGSNPFEPAKNVLGTDENETVQATINAILPRAQELGCMLVIENIFDRNPSRLRSIVESFDSEYVRMSIDIGHAHVMSKLGGAAPDQWVLEAGDLLAHLHLQDTDGDADRHWTPGVGSIQWKALFDALDAQGGDPRLIIETGEDLVKGANWLSEQGYVS
jgi:sugar phosphate isomerase/epimerase